MNTCCAGVKQSRRTNSTGSRVATECHVSSVRGTTPRNTAGASRRQPQRAKSSRPDARLGRDGALTAGKRVGHITSMALSRKKATTIALDPEDDRLLSRAARERGVSRSEFIRQHLALVLEQYRRHPKPRSAGSVRALTERGDERELFSARR